MTTARKKKARRSGPSKVLQLVESRSGGLGVDLGEIVLRGLGTLGDELAEIFGGGLRPRDEHFAARTDHVRLDLDGFAQRLGRSELVDAGEERFGVLVERLLDVAADLGGLGTEPATAVSIAAVTFSVPAWMSAARTLAVSACFFTNSRAASGTSRF